MPLPESRRQRVRGLLSTLQVATLLPAGMAKATNGSAPASPIPSCSTTATDAVAAYRERLPKMIELAKAIEIAKLEADGEYSEARHDAFFAEFGDNGLDAERHRRIPATI